MITLINSDQTEFSSVVRGQDDQLVEVLAKIHQLEAHFNATLQQLTDVFSDTLGQELSKMAANHSQLHTSLTNHSLRMQSALEEVILNPTLTLILTCNFDHINNVNIFTVNSFVFCYQIVFINNTMLLFSLAILFLSDGLLNGKAVQDVLYQIHKIRSYVLLFVFDARKVPS